MLNWDMTSLLPVSVPADRVEDQEVAAGAPATTP